MTEVEKLLPVGRKRRYTAPIWIEEFLDAGHEVARDGTVVLYHATTAQKAKKILKEGVLRRPADAPDRYGVYFSTSPDVANEYGDGTLVMLRAPIEHLKYDDYFPSGRMDFHARTHRGVYRPLGIVLFGAKQNPLRGSRNYEARVAQGWREGPARYADEEPHHAKSQHGSWTYVTMHDAPRERLLSLIVDGEHDGEPASGKLSADVFAREEWPATSDDPRSDYEAAINDGDVRTYIVRNASGVTDYVPIDPGEEYALYSMGWDYVSIDDGAWAAEFAGTLERPP